MIETKDEKWVGDMIIALLACKSMGEEEIFEWINILSVPRERLIMVKNLKNLTDKISVPYPKINVTR